MRLVLPADRVEVEDAGHLGLAGVGEGHGHRSTTEPRRSPASSGRASRRGRRPSRRGRRASPRTSASAPVDRAAARVPGAGMSRGDVEDRPAAGLVGGDEQAERGAAAAGAGELDEGQVVAAGEDPDPTRPGRGAPQAVHGDAVGSGRGDRGDPSAASLAGARRLGAGEPGRDTPRGYDDAMRRRRTPPPEGPDRR